MKTLGLVMLACLMVISSSLAQTKGTDERIMQTFAVMLGEQKISTDFALRVRWLQGVDIITSISDGMKITRMDVVYEDDQFKFFKLARENKEELTVKTKRDSFVVSHVTKGTSTLPRRGDEIILEPGAYGEYAFLIHRYNAAKGGKQTFPILVPSRSAFTSAEVERHGSDTLRCGAILISAPHYRTVLEKKELVHLWSTPEGKVIAFHIPSKGVCVVDEEYESLHQNIRSLAYGNP
jgi:hypothetical protein